MRGRSLFGVVVVLSAGACSASGDEEVTWFGEVEPVVAVHCARCRQADGVGVGDFTDPRQAADYASLMLSAVDDGRMPPPASDPACRDYVGSDAMILDPAERDLLAAWVAAGAPLGDPSDAAGVVPADDALAAPDLELRIPAPYTPAFADPESVDNEYRCFVLDPDRDEDFYITALAPIVDQRSVVHHAVLLVKDRSAVTPAELAPEGVNCMGGAGSEANGRTVVGWAPGMLPVELPPDTGIRVGADQVLILQMHYFRSPGSEGVADRSGYAFRTASQVATRAATRQAGIADFVIPAGDPAFEVDGVYTPRFDEEVLGVFPHMHTLGQRFRAAVVRPDGSETCLVSGGYAFDNQLTYPFMEAAPLGPDDRMTFSCTWNNSSSNPEVDGEPVPTTFGERTDQEMCVFFTLVREVGEGPGPAAADPVDPRALAPGAFQLNFASDAAGTFVEDACVGEVTAPAAPATEARGTCVLQGMMAGLFGSDPKAVVIGGWPDGGQVTVDLGVSPFGSAWSAEIVDSSVFGAFAGTAPITTPLGTADLSFAGGFHVDGAP